MKHTEKEIQLLKDEVKLMWKLVISQLENAKKAMLNNDIALATKIIRNENDVNTFELKVDNLCENFIALNNPVAIDLRLALSLIKISSSLERIGDFTDGIARFITDKECETIDQDLIERLNIEKMFDILLGMLLDGFVAFETEQTKVSEKIISKDDQVDEIYNNVFETLATHIKNNPAQTICMLKLLLLIRKLERIGDHNNNIVEEIVFFVDARVLKHSGSNNF